MVYIHNSGKDTCYVNDTQGLIRIQSLHVIIQSDIKNNDTQLQVIL